MAEVRHYLHNNGRHCESCGRFLKKMTRPTHFFRLILGGPVEESLDTEVTWECGNPDCYEDPWWDYVY